MNASLLTPTANIEESLPPLPDTISVQQDLQPQPSLREQPVLQPFPRPRPWQPIQVRSLRCGCYLVNYKPTGNSLVTFDGTLRVECSGATNRTASGDLYQRRIVWLPWRPGFPPRPPQPVLLPGPNPAAGIPILSRSRYRYYLRITQILEWITFGNSFTLGFEMRRFTKSSGPWNTGGTWSNEGAFTALMSWQTAPAGYPSSGDYLEGDVKNSAGVVVGRLSMGWLSDYLRKATVEIDRVSASEAPLNNGAGVDWRAVGDSVDWDITVDVSDSNVAQPSGVSWSDAECHAAMLARRDAANLDAEWRYHVLCIRNHDNPLASRGIMYDAYGSDSNNVPREGCVVASHWTIPNSPEWGTVQGQRFGAAAAPYFRTAVHEIGHAMGLYHNTADNGFMNTTNVIANNSLAPGSPSFPGNVQWSYNAEDAKRLRHMPDIYVRPGGTPFGTTYSSTPISPTDLEMDVEELELRVAPLLEAVPIGAPVRINMELKNTSDSPVPAPASLSMKSGNVKGKVIDPAGAERTFSPIVLCVEEESMGVLDQKQSLNHSMTLLRGVQGPLFPMPGVHRLIVEVHWDCGGVEALATAETTVMITSAVDDAHAQAARQVLSTPDALLTLVVGGDHLQAGIDAIEAALDNPVLRPHFAYIEAKRVSERFGKRKASLSKADKLIDDDTVMSPAEIKKMSKLVVAEGADSAPGKRIASTLKSNVKKMDVSDEVKDAVDAL